MAFPSTGSSDQRISFFFFNDPATTEIYTLSLHDALPILDFSSTRYVTVGQHFFAPGFEEVYSDADTPVRIVENRYARPRFQAFRNAKFVPSLPQAVAAVAGLDSDTLIVEQGGAAPLNYVAAAQGSQTWRLIEDRSDRYQLDIEASSPFWLFLADSNYPGWNAYIDDVQTPLYSAQLLGKAVWVPAGTHQLRLVFEPMSFRLGLAVSLLGIAVMVCGFVWQYIRNRPAIPAAGR